MTKMLLGYVKKWEAYLTICWNFRQQMQYNFVFNLFVVEDGSQIRGK